MDIMKKYIFATFIAGVAAFFTGCSDDLEQFTVKHSGEEILFGGRAGFEMTGDEAKNASQTRTVYTGNTWEAVDEDGVTKTYEGVNWIAGDKVRIYSPQTAGTTMADYNVVTSNTEAISGTEEHEVALNKIGGVGLQWGETGEDAVYDFYAVYPSPEQYPLKDGVLDNTVSNKVLKGSTTVSGTIPLVQTPLKRTSAKDDGNYVFAPHMEYAYMVARQHIANPSKNAKEVYLNFVPIATAVEIELYNAITGYETNLSTLLLTNVLISANNESTPIAGDFTADLSKLTDGNADGSYCGIPTSGFVSTGTNTYNQITVPMYEDGLYGDPTPLAPGKSIKFTVFMLPTQDVDDLKVTIQGATGAATGSTNGVEIKMHKKTYLKKMPVTNAVMPFDQSRWVEYLPDNAYLKGLSIPGAGGATSGHITHTDANKTFLEQKYDIPTLWSYGIRCFEFTVDYIDDVTNLTTDGDLANNIVFCNTINTGVTLKDAVAAVKTQLVTYPEEFAMVIITYQAQKGWETRNGDTGAVTNTNKRDPQAFASQLKAFWDNVSGTTYSEWPEKNGIQTGTKLYSTGLTVNEARGQLFCIARPTSEGEDNYAVITEQTTSGFLGITSDRWYTLTKASLTPVTIVHPKVMVIHGWGALKDKWEARGFTPCIFQRGIGNSYFQRAISHGKYEIFYDSNLPGRPFEVANSGVDGLTGTLDKDAAGNAIDGAKYVSSKVETLVPDFYYGVQAGTATVTANGAWVQEWARVSPEAGVKGGANSKYSWWPSSIEEKKARIQECLDYALKGTKGSDVVYINSLCGYFIDVNNWTSCEPNSLTESNITDNILPTTSGLLGLDDLTSATSTSGMSGDIAGYAKYINEYFYGYLQKTIDGSDFVPGPMGIILMDRVAEETASTQIPSIIIANNFQHVLPAKPATYSLRKSNYEEGDKFAAPAQRGVKSSNEGVSIVWE